ncbi:unnamed protein product [Sphagnum troendelagicum]
MASAIPYTVMEGFIHIYAKLSVYLHPSRVANVQQGVHEIMNSLLLRKIFLLFSVSRFVCFLFGKFDFSFCGVGEHLQRANRRSDIDQKAWHLWMRACLQTVVLFRRYNEEFEGVVLAYLDPKIQGPTANILSGLPPYFHVQLKASFLLFSPKIGMLVEGKVNKVEKDYLGVVVLGLFNAAIGIADIREDLYYDDSVCTYLHPPSGVGEVSG